MPVPVDDVNTLRQYIDGVMGRAQHHGPRVNAILLALAGAIVWRKDTQPIQVHAGRTMRHGTVLWVRINGNRYAFKYSHRAQQIEMRRGSTRGAVVHRFDNSTSVAAVERIFRAL
jgi:Integron cassette protein VCH_CASS1 chain